MRYALDPHSRSSYSGKLHIPLLKPLELSVPKYRLQWDFHIWKMYTTDHFQDFKNDERIHPKGIWSTSVAVDIFHCAARGDLAIG